MSKEKGYSEGLDLLALSFWRPYRVVVNRLFELRAEPRALLVDLS